MASHVQGVVYLLHFVDERGYHYKFKHAGHYMGWATDLDARLALHRIGQGANLLRYVVAAGGRLVLARTWRGDRFDERRLKNLGGHERKCPLCHGMQPDLAHLRRRRRALVEPSQLLVPRSEEVSA